MTLSSKTLRFLANKIEEINFKKFYVAVEQQVRSGLLGGVGKHFYKKVFLKFFIRDFSNKKLKKRRFYKTWFGILNNSYFGAPSRDAGGFRGVFLPIFNEKYKPFFNLFFEVFLVFFSKK